MSELWVAEHHALRAQVVVKFLSPDLASDKVSVARFQREAGAAAQVKSPHVVQYFDHGVCDHGPYLVMELLEGTDLSHRLKHGPMPLRDVAQVVVQICRALQRAHAAGIVHRDIKPDNIFLVEVDSNDIFCKLIDFGVAKGKTTDVSVMSRTATGSMLGTPYYMSPEQAINAGAIDFRTDLWALGMVAFEAMTGRKAFDVDGLGALVLALHTAELPSPSRFNPSIPPGLDRWFARACAKEPSGRFSDAREMAEAFLKALDEPAPAPAPAQIPRSADLPDLDHDAPKVPTLRPPAVGADATPRPRDGRSVRDTGPRGAPEPRIDLSPDVGPRSPRHSRYSSMPEPDARRSFFAGGHGDKPSMLLWLIAAALGMLLFVGISMAVQGEQSLKTLFPGLYPQAPAAPERKP